MRTSSRRGGAALEFALVLPVLLTLLFGIMEYGWLFLQQSNVVSAVREGTRLGVTYAQDDSPDPVEAAETRVTEALVAYGFDPATIAVEATYEGTSPDELLRVQCTVSYDALFGLYVAVPDQLSSTMTMLLEDQD